MQNARYFREQALRCLQLARHMKDVKTAANLRNLAAHYCTRAAEIESTQSGSGEFAAGHLVRSPWHLDSDQPKRR
jgi:hypothetical protein